MVKAKWMHIVNASIIAGVVLTLFLKLVQFMTTERVYTLLLNVDYLPVLKNYIFPEWIEVGFHLVVSVAVGICFYIFFNKKKIDEPQKQLMYTVCCSLLIGLVLFPTTYFSLRTPSIKSGTALFYWLIGHALFGYVLGLLLVRTTTKK